MNPKLTRPVKIILLLLLLWAAWKAATGMLAPKDGLEIVRTVPVKRGDLVVKITSTGEVKPQNRLEIKPAISGRIEEILVREGDAVKKGQILAWMSSTERAALLDAASSQGAEAMDRWQQAYKPAPLVAPLEGTVIVRSVEPGQTVTPADPVVVLSDRLIVKALVDETDLAMIHLGQKTKISLDAYRDQVFDAKVDHISYESTLVNNVNVYEVDILPETVPEAFRSGMTANATFIVSEKKDALLVPSEAVVSWPKKIPKSEKNPGEFAVYRKAFGGKIRPAAVTAGESDGRMTEILDGLKEGDAIAVVRYRESGKGTNPFSPHSSRNSSRGSRPSSS